MNVQFDNLAPLPMRTWSWTGVNNTRWNMDIPEIKQHAFPKPSLSTGIQRVERIPSEVFSIQTGLDEEYVDFIDKNCNRGEVLHVAENKKAEKPLIYHYELDGEVQALVDSTTIIAEKNSEITIVQSYSSKQGAFAFHAGLTRILAKEGAKVKLVTVQLLDDTSANLTDVGATLYEGASVEVVHIEFGAIKTVVGGNSHMVGKNAHTFFDTIYFGDKDRELDFNYLVRHDAPETYSDVLASGALFGKTIKNYRGTLDFVRGCALSVGQEHENILLFSPEARNLSTPLILAGEDAVEGMHAATIGKADAGKMFYLQSRGLSELAAKRLILEAQYAKTLAKIPDESLQEKAYAFYEERVREL